MIYFMQARAGGLIKIGLARDPKKRLSKVQAFCPVPLRMIGTMPGDVEAEKALHIRFDGLRRHGEWFIPDPSLIEFIERSSTPWPRDDRDPCVRPTRIHRTTGLTSPVTAINCTLQYKEWSYALAESLGLPLSSVVGLALVRVAESVDFERPPEQGEVPMSRREIKPGSLVSIVGTVAWREWLNRLANFRGMTIVETVRSALRDFAMTNGFDRSPPAR